MDIRTLNGVELFPWESLDDLQIGGYKLIQDKRGFKFGTDAVLLANFADIRKGETVADFCTGSGIIPVLLAAKTEASHITGIEIQGEIAGAAARSVRLNGLQDRVEVIQGDIKNAHELLQGRKCDVITCNPPYMPGGGGLVNPNDMKALSRHELLCSLEDVFRSASKVLRYGGRLFMIHRADRLPDLIQISRKYRLEPKSMRLIHPSPGKNANLVLFSAVHGGGPQLNCLPPLFIRGSDGEFSEELKLIYKYPEEAEE